MKNPYEEALPKSTVTAPRAVIVGALLLSGILLLAVPLIGIFGGNERALPDKTMTLREKLRAVDRNFSSMSLFAKGRDADRRRFYRWFGFGNDRVLVDGDQLFYRPDIEAVVGKGPTHVEPRSVARDPSLEPWQPPLPVVRDFVEQCASRGIRVVIVPVPTKVPGGEALPADWSFVLAEIESSGAEVVDLSGTIESLRQDTHWTPQSMQRAASHAAEKIPNGAALAATILETTRDHHGDLAAMLVPDAEGFPPETATIARVIDRQTEKLLPFDNDADIVILGDSFANIYEDPTLGFAAEGEERIGAGFASHLSAELGRPVAQLASNGGGATATRKRFGLWLAQRDREPEAVVWVLSARDLFLAENAARRAGVAWEFVKLPEISKSAPPTTDPGEVVFTATLREKSVIAQETTDGTAPYESAIYSAVFDSIEVESGDYEPSEAWVFLWAARERKLVDTAGLDAGKRYRLRLGPMPESGPVASATRLDDFFFPDLEPLFVESAEPAE